MTDSSSLLPNSVALTSDLHYSLKPSAVRSRSYRASILPTNKSTFSAGDTGIFYIPAGRRGTYLDQDQSYIRMTIQVNVEDAWLDASANCVINRLDVFHGSNLLESIIGYNLLSTYILDLQSAPSQRVGLSNLYGFDDAGDRQGKKLLFGTTKAITVCLPIFSGVVGCLCDKMLPLSKLNDDIRLEFTFESNANALYSAGGTATYTILDAQLELAIVELSDEGESMVNESLNPNSPIYLHGSSWRRYTSSLPRSTGSYSTLVPARFASLKQLVMLPRRSSDQVAASYAISSRVNPFISSYFWRIGASQIPNKPVVLENSANTGSYAEGYAELLKSWHGLHTVDNSCALGLQYNIAPSAIAGTQVAQASAVGGNAYKNGFVIAQELESFANRTDVLLSGLNTLSSQVFFEATISTDPATTFTLDFFGWYDHILVIENGIMSVRF